MFYRSVLRTVLIAFVLATFAPAADAATQYDFSRETLAPLQHPLKAGARIRIERVPLVDGRPATLELERFEVWTERADIQVFGEKGRVIHRLSPTAHRFYRGDVSGHPDSLVYFSVLGDRVEGFVYAADRRLTIQSHRGRIVVNESSVVDDIPPDGQSFICELEKRQINPETRPRALANASGRIAGNAAPTGTQRSVINLAIDTDYELFVNAGGSSARVTTYLANLIGAISTIYNRDLLTEVRISFLGIQSSADDPFTVVPGQTGTWNGSSKTLFAAHAQAELADRWHNTTPSPAPRSAAVLISGKQQTVGVAGRAALCTADYLCQGGACGSSDWDGHYVGAYAYCGGIYPPGDLSVPNPDAPNYAVPSSNYWALLSVSHEIGHLVGSRHTNCISLTPEQKTTYGVSRNYVDECRSGEGGCFSGTTSLPVEKGTIMSYCHTYGSTNTRFTFGQPGETSEIVRTNMRLDMAGKTPSLSSITAPANLENGQTGNASVASQDGVTFSWTITNGTITSGGDTNAISFTGTVDPVTLRVTATNPSGCSVSDTATVRLPATFAAPANFAAAATAATNVSSSWSAVPNASMYEIWRSSNGIDFAKVGETAATSHNDGSALANTAYLYKVRAAGGAFSLSDLASTWTFVDPTIVAGATKIKLAHVTDLRAAVNAVRTLAGLGAMSFGAPAPGAGGIVRAAHLAQLRTALNAARSELGLTTLAADPTVTAGGTILSLHITQIRGGVN